MTRVLCAARGVSRWRSLLVVACVFAGAGVTLVGGRVYLEAKGALAAILIDRALTRHLEDGLPHPPWPWADTHPIARLEVPRLGISRSILSDASGSSLAFGLGHIGGTVAPGAPGNSGIAGHRDTRAAFLKDLRRGDLVRVRTHATVKTCTVSGSRIVPKQEISVLDPSPTTRLTLVTCYPFGGILRSPWRIVVECPFK